MQVVYLVGIIAGALIIAMAIEIHRLTSIARLLDEVWIDSIEGLFEEQERDIW